MTYTLSRTALADLQAIREYLYSAPPDIQLKVIARLNEGFQRACDLPATGRLESEFSGEAAGPIRSILVRPYRIFYRERTVPRMIVAILHGARDISSVLEGRRSGGF